MVGWRLPRPGLVGKGNKPATMPMTVPVLRVLEAWRGERIEGRLVLRLLTGNPIDRRDAYRMVARIAKGHRHPSAHQRALAAPRGDYQRLDAGVLLRDAQILARHADPRTTEHYRNTDRQPSAGSRPLRPIRRDRERPS